MKPTLLDITVVVAIVASAIAVASTIFLATYKAFGQSRRERRVESIKNLYILEDGRVTLTKIIEIPDASAAEIFSLVQAALSNTKLNADYEIISLDESNGKISAKGEYTAYYKRKPTSRSGLGASIENSLEVAVKDGKARVVMKLDSYKNEVINLDVSSIYPINDKVKQMTIVGNRMMRDPATRAVTPMDASKYFHAAVTTGYEVLDKMEELMNPTSDNW